jgi:hypothetical protein
MKVKRKIIGIAILLSLVFALSTLLSCSSIDVPSSPQNVREDFLEECIEIMETLYRRIDRVGITDDDLLELIELNDKARSIEEEYLVNFAIDLVVTRNVIKEMPSEDIEDIDILLSELSDIKDAVRTQKDIITSVDALADFSIPSRLEDVDGLIWQSGRMYMISVAEKVVDYYGEFLGDESNQDEIRRVRLSLNEMSEYANTENEVVFVDALTKWAFEFMSAHVSNNTFLLIKHTSSDAFERLAAEMLQRRSQRLVDEIMELSPELLRIRTTQELMDWKNEINAINVTDELSFGD